MTGLRIFSPVWRKKCSRNCVHHILSWVRKEKWLAHSKQYIIFSSIFTQPSTILHLLLFQIYSPSKNFNNVWQLNFDDKRRSKFSSSDKGREGKAIFSMLHYIGGVCPQIFLSLVLVLSMHIILYECIEVYMYITFYLILTASGRPKRESKAKANVSVAFIDTL